MKSKIKKAKSGPIIMVISRNTNQAPITNSTASLMRSQVNQPAPIQVAQGNHTFTDPTITMAVNAYPMPQSVAILVVSDAGAGAAATEVFLVNQEALNNVTDNGSGAGSIEYTYQDGFGGNVFSRIVTLARAAVGGICYGISIRATITATGAGNPGALAVANPSFQQFNALGGTTFVNMNITQDQTRGDFDTSIEVIKCAVNVTAFTQFAFTALPANSYTVTMYFTPTFAVS